jgi:hypothetical protein
MIGRLLHDKPRAATEERASGLRKQLTEVRAALAEAEARSEERRLALEGRIQDVGLMRIQLRARDARIAALEKEVSDLGSLVRRSEQPTDAKSESAFLTQMRAALAESEARSDERRLALESRNQELGLMRIQLRVRDARIVALDKEVSDSGGALARRNERSGEVNSDTTAFLNETIGALTATVAQRDGTIAALKATQLADAKTLAALQGDLVRATADTEAQRKNLGRLEATLAAANTRLAEEQAATLAALELRKSMEAAISEQRQRVARLEVELAAVVRDRDTSLAAAAAVQAEHLEQGARLATASARLLELEAEALDRARGITALHEEARVNPEPARALEANLRAAEESLHRHETDLHMESACLDDMAKTHDEIPQGAAPLFIRTDESEIVHVLGRKTTIGRTAENDVQIDAKFISRHHAVILSGTTDTIIEDLNSTNGVSVNGRRVMRQSLRDGDVVLIGNVPFRFAAPRERVALKARA